MRWKKSLLLIHKILRLFVNTFTSHDKHYLLNRDNLTQPIQKQLSQKQKTFSAFFFCFFAFLKSILNFKHFPKKRWHPSMMYFPKYRFQKTCLDKCLKSRDSGILRQRTWKMGQNAVAMWMTAPAQYLLITVNVVALEKVSFSDTQNLKPVC